MSVIDAAQFRFTEKGRQNFQFAAELANHSLTGPTASVPFTWNNWRLYVKVDNLPLCILYLCLTSIAHPP